MNKRIPNNQDVTAEVQVVEIDQNYCDLFRAIIKERLGIYVSPSKDYLIKAKLGRLIKKEEYGSVAEFYKLLKTEDLESLENLIHYITTTHTFFFREKQHLRILRNDILIKKHRRPVIWCAATSTGEEVYSMIIELLEHGITDFLIVASDINREVLFRCKKGIYRQERMKELSDDLVKKYFKPVPGLPGRFQVRKFLKDYFICKRLNLIESFRFEQQFDYIFCRNVLIYFDQETQGKVVNNLLANLKPLGYLFVGHSESLLNFRSDLESAFSSVYNIKT
jgi:chemotaxis protein methyltransferase CheR